MFDSQSEGNVSVKFAERSVSGQKFEHFGPEPNAVAAGVGAGHRLVCAQAAGKKIRSVYMGDTEYRDWITNDLEASEYLIFEFDDGTALALYTEEHRFGFEVAPLRSLKKAKKHRKQTETP